MTENKDLKNTILYLQSELNSEKAKTLILRKQVDELDFSIYLLQKELDYINTKLISKDQQFEKQSKLFNDSLTLLHIKPIDFNSKSQ